MVEDLSFLVKVISIFKGYDCHDQTCQGKRKAYDKNCSSRFGPEILSSMPYAYKESSSNYALHCESKGFDCPPEQSH